MCISITKHTGKLDTSCLAGTQAEGELILDRGKDSREGGYGWSLQVVQNLHVKQKEAWVYIQLKTPLNDPKQHTRIQVKRQKTKWRKYLPRI